MTKLAIFTAWRCASAVYAVIVCPSVCLSVTSRSSTKKARLRITQTTPYDSPGILRSWYEKSRRNSDDIIFKGEPNRGGVDSNRRFSTNISQHLRNGERWGHCYCGSLIRTRSHSKEWRHFQRPWVTLKYPNDPYFDILYHLSCLCTG